MTEIQSSPNLLKIGNRHYRNPICLAREWQHALNDGKFASLAALARHLGVSRARVTQIMNLLKLAPEVIQMISSFGDPLRSPFVTERRLRPLLSLNLEQQKVQVEIILSKNTHE
jgi:ParB-like chromosome segregation protein Spo0J